VSLFDVSQNTHIRESFLTAIEESDFEALPSVGHTKGFVVSYAQHLGLDGNALAAAIADEMKPKQVKSRGAFDRAQQTDKTSTDRHEIPWKIVWALLAAIVLTGGVVWALTTFVFSDSAQTPKPPLKTITTIDTRDKDGDELDSTEEAYDEAFDFIEGQEDNGAEDVRGDRNNEDTP